VQTPDLLILFSFIFSHFTSELQWLSSFFTGSFEELERLEITNVSAFMFYEG
jgi:hypothetical protein